MSADSSRDLGQLVKGHMPVMDGWRGIAILTVVLHNAGFIVYDYPRSGTLVENLSETILAAGWVGVQLFFVLSGFLITGILLDTRESPNFFRDFYIRRALRIFPLYYGFLFLVLVIVPSLAGGADWAAGFHGDERWYWLYLSNWIPLIQDRIGLLNHAWSLGVEEQFYLLWPPVVLLAGRRGLPWVIGAIIMGAPASRLLMHGMGLDPEYLYEFTFARADALAIGAAMALLARSANWRERAWRSRRVLFLVASGGLVPVTIAGRGFAQYEPLGLIGVQSLIAFWFAALMMMSLTPEGRLEGMLSRLLKARSLRVLGKYSYAVYLFHYTVSQLIRPLVVEAVNPPSPTTRVAFALGYGLFILALCTAMAWCSWHLFEKRFLALKDRWAPRPVPPQPGI